MDLEQSSETQFSLSTMLFALLIGIAIGVVISFNMDGSQTRAQVGGIDCIQWLEDKLNELNGGGASGGEQRAGEFNAAGFNGVKGGGHGSTGGGGGEKEDPEDQGECGDGILQPAFEECDSAYPLCIECLKAPGYNDQEASEYSDDNQAHKAAAPQQPTSNFGTPEEEAAYGGDFGTPENEASYGGGGYDDDDYVSPGVIPEDFGGADPREQDKINNPYGSAPQQEYDGDNGTPDYNPADNAVEEPEPAGFFDAVRSFIKRGDADPESAGEDSGGDLYDLNSAGLNSSTGIGDTGSSGGSGGGGSSEGGFPYCGDGLENAPDEECDDGNLDDNDGCSSICQLEICGDTITQPPVEECDDGNRTDGDGCRWNCVDEYCGDGIINDAMGRISNEYCDDGNTVSGDGCSSLCQTENCGDGTIDAGEMCDNGSANTDSGSLGSCKTDCTYNECGDGDLDANELCDDGNRITGDGCGSTCQDTVTAYSRTATYTVERTTLDSLDPCAAARSALNSTGPTDVTIEAARTLCDADNGTFSEGGTTVTDLCQQYLGVQCVRCRAEISVPYSCNGS